MNCKKTLSSFSLAFILLLIAGELASLTANGQTLALEWAYRTGSTGFDEGLSIATDASKNIYTAGHFRGTVDFDPGAGTTNLAAFGALDDAFITKSDAGGNLVWARSFGSTSEDVFDRANAVVVHSSGDIYVAGEFRGTVDFDPGAGVANLTSVGSQDAFILKLDNNGNFIWVKSFSGTTNDEIPGGITTDATGNVYLTGEFEGPTDFDPGAGIFTLTGPFPHIFIAKLDVNGNFVWARQMGENIGGQGNSIAVDALGNVYSTGEFRGTTDFDPGAGVFNITAVSPAADDIYVSKLNSSGNFVWAKAVGSTGEDKGEGITIDASNNLYITGYFDDTADFDPNAGTFNMTTAGSDEVFVWKLDVNGNFIWAKQLGGEEEDDAFGIDTDATGVYTTGFFQDVADFDPGAGTFNLTSSGGSYDIFVSKLDHNGNFVWATGIGSTGNDYGRAIAADGSGYAITTGNFKLTADFDPGASTLNLVSAGSDDIFVQKIKAAPPAVPSITNFNPASAIPGAALTITGTNFGTSIAQNAVYFGTTKATVTTATATQLVVTIPKGCQYGPLTVVNLSTGLLVQSAKHFTPLFDNNKDFGGRIIPSSLDIKDDLTLSNTKTIQGLSLGDLDGDGLVDIIVSEPNIASDISEISIFRNLGVTGDINATSFAPKILLGRGVLTSIIVDLDGDGKLDIAVLDTDFASTSTTVTYRNISTPGNIAFEAGEPHTNSSYSAVQLHAADIDGDGRMELMASHGASGVGPYFWIFQNTSTSGDISFGPAVVWSGTFFTAARYISTGDLDGDGKAEVLVVHSFENEFSIYHNSSTPGFISLDPPFKIDPTNEVNNVVIADLDNDNKPDLTWASTNAATAIRIRKNIHTAGALSAASFGAEIVIPATSFAANDLSLADMNSDGKLDIVATDDIKLGVFESVFNGTLASTSFLAPVFYEGNIFQQNPSRPLIADLDGDNKPDVVTATQSSIPVQIFIYRNTSYPAPTIGSVTPSTGNTGTPLTISGNFMNTNLDTPKIKLGPTTANTGTTSNTSVSTSIPSGTMSDRISVTLHGLTAFSSPLTVTFPTSHTIDASSFTAPIEFAMTAAADGLTLGDFDDDGKTDVVVDDNSNVRIFRNTLSAPGAAISTSTLTAIATAYTQAAHVTATDVDGDGKTDVIANGFLHRNNSGSTADAISFEANVNSIVSGFNRVAVDHDFNHDGKSDFAVTTNGNTYNVFQNSSRKGPFTWTGGTIFSTAVNTGISTAAGGQVTGITAGDFDGDGYSDFAYGANNTPDILAVVRNTGLNQPLAPASFDPAVTFPALDIPFSIASADFDGDGKPDIVLGNNNAAFISVYRNTSTPGSIVFLAKQDIAALTKAIDIKAVDLDGDGKAEIIVAHQPTATTGSFTVFQNTSTSGTISFATGINYALTRGPLALVIADINQDTKPDLIFTANGATDVLMIFENKIASGPVITINPQPTSTAVCDGSVASFTLTASGAANLTYQWQKFDGAIFNNITNTGGYSGTTTSTLTINTTGNFGGGDYRCKVSGDLATDKFSNTVTLAVNAVPAAPATTGDSDCVPASLTLTASGASNGQYRWYTAQTGGSPIAAQVNSTYATPVISTTTTYYASINNGSCESVRTAAVATIAPLEKPEITFDPPIFTSGVVNLCDGDVQKFVAPPGFEIYSWSSGESSYEITITTSGVYTVTIEDVAGCISPPSDPVTVVINPYPLAEITVNGSQLIASTGDTYQWYQNGSQIAGATGGTFDFNVLEYGEYIVEVTDNGCTSTSDPYLYLITATENSQHGWKVHPNPFDDAIHIETPSEDNFHIEIIDVLGRSVKQFEAKNNQLLDLHELKESHYIMAISTNKRTFHFRIIKKK